MTATSSSIVQRVWNYCNVLRDESLENSDNLPAREVLASEIVEDLRDWAPDGEKMGKGVTLSKDELLALKELLNTLEI